MKYLILVALTFAGCASEDLVPPNNPDSPVILEDGTVYLSGDFGPHVGFDGPAEMTNYPSAEYIRVRREEETQFAFFVLWMNEAYADMSINALSEGQYDNEMIGIQVCSGTRGLQQESLDYDRRPNAAALVVTDTNVGKLYELSSITNNYDGSVDEASARFVVR